MKFTLKSINNKNNSQLNMKQLNSARYNIQDKILTSKKKNFENSKSLAYSNSNLNIKSNINRKKELLSLDFDNENLDEIPYNEELYIIPKKNPYKRFYTSNIEKAIEAYNEIKKVINKKLNNKKNFTSIKSIQIQNLSMVNLLEKLNSILDVIVERSRLNNNKNKGYALSESQEIKKNKEMKSGINNAKRISEKDINNKLLNSYKQQYSLLSSKFDSLTKGNYAINLKLNITKFSDDISKLEKENRELHRTQSRNELILKNIKTTKNEDNYKKKLEEYDKLSIEYESLNKYIKIKQGEIKSNDRRLLKLEENKKILLKKAKDEYHIQNPEEIIDEKKDEKELEKIKMYIKRKELENKVLILNSIIKKFVIMEKDNKKFIRQLEEKIAESNYYLKLKKEEIIKLNEILDKIDIENNNLIFKTEIDKENYVQKDIKEINNEQENNPNLNSENLNFEQIINIHEFNKNLKQKGVNLSNPEIGVKEINNRYSIKKEKNSDNSQVAKTYNKKMILQQLDDQKRREQDGLNRIKLNKKNLKPNFSFSLNNSSRKEVTEKNVNLSAAVISNRNNSFEVKNEPEGEIKEDIKIIPYDDNIKVKLEEEEQRITNMSQNIVSLEKKGENIVEEANLNEENKILNSEEKNRQKVLNTLPFYELEESEKNLKIDEQNNSEDNNRHEEEKKDNEILNEENKENEILDENNNDNNNDNKNEDENYQEELINMEI